MVQIKKHANNAARQKSWRLNNSIKKALSGSPQPETSEEKNLQRVQGQWNTRNGYSQIEKGFLQNKEGEAYLLMKDSDSLEIKPHWLLFIRYNNPLRNEVTSYKKYNDLESAQKDFANVVFINEIPEEWKNVDHYLLTARSLLWGHQRKLQNKTSFPKYLAFYMAVAELVENGCTFDDKTQLDGTKQRKNDEYKATAQWMKRLVVNEVGNFNLPCDIEHDELINVMECLFKKLGERKNSLKEGTPTTNEYFRSKCNVIINALSQLGKRYSSLFPAFKGIKDDLYELTEEVIDYLEDGEDGVASCLRKVKNYPPMTNLSDIKLLLDEAWKTNIEIYSAIILELSTLVRPSEARRLFRQRELYLRDDGTLNYRGLLLEEPDWLVQKTKKTVNPSTDLVNPLLSVVSRMILNYPNEDYGSPKIFPADFFEAKEGRVRSNPRLEVYHERCMRTTGAVMLAYCEKAEIGRTVREDVKERMGHKSKNMIDTVYVKHFPSHSLPENFFEICGDLDHDGFLVSKDSFLWDTWLLHDFIERYKEKYKDQPEMLEKFWVNLINESKAFQKIVNKNKVERKNIPC